MDSAIDAFLDTDNPFKAADAMMRAVHFRRRAGIAHDDMVDRLIAFAEAQESPPQRRSIGATAGRTAFDFNRLDTAEKLLTAALEIALSKDWRDERDALTASDLLGRICRLTGRYREALGHYDRALPLAERLADPDAEATVRGNRAIALRYLDRIDEALSDYEAAIAISERR
jgi:tetratricopeptide (TPR) repeat protein